MLNLLSPALFTNHRGQGKADGPSNRIWSLVKGELVSPDGQKAARGYVSNYSSDHYDTTNATAQSSDGVEIFGDAGSGAVSQADGSGVLITADGTNLEANIITGGNVAGIGTLSLDKVLAYEVAVTLTPAATTNFGLIAGVIEPGSGGDNAIVNSSCLPKASTDYVGFNVKADNSIVFVYQKAAVGITTVSGVSQAITSGSTYKLGFVIDPNSSEERLKVYIDGVQKKALSKADLDGDANWPDDTNFAAILGAKSVSGSGQTAKAAFMHCVQVA